MHRNTLRQIVLPALLLAGDLVFAFAGLSLAWWLRYDTRLGQLGLPVESAAFADYLPLLLVGVTLLVVTYAQLGLYDERLLLRRYQALAIITKGTVLWLLAYLGVSLVLKFSPPISRLFVAVAFLGVVLLEYVWRSAFYAAICRGSILERVQQRVAVLGWNDNAARNVAAVTGACLLTRTTPYREFDGFDETDFRVAYNDDDFCLRSWARVHRVVVTPQAVLQHVGSASRGREYTEKEHLAFVARHGAHRDPFLSDTYDFPPRRASIPTITSMAVTCLQLLAPAHCQLTNARPRGRSPLAGDSEPAAFYGIREIAALRT